jgi:HlyD family secretion protein
MEPDDIHLRSEPVRDMLSRPPHALLRWGNTAVFFAVLLLIAVSFLIKYPQVVEAPVSITTAQPPVSVKAMSSGKIALLLVQEGQQVGMQQHLAVIENAGKYQDWMQVQAQFRPFYQKIILGSPFPKMPLGKEVSLGEAQSAYTQFFGAHQAYWHFVETNIYEQRIAQLRLKIIAQRRLSEGLSEQEAILATDFGLAQKQYEKDQQLFGKKVITEQDLERSQQVLLQQSYKLKAAGLEQINAGIRIQEQEAQVLELRQQHLVEYNRHLEALKQASLNMESALSLWQQRYILQAPSAGKVAFFKFRADQQFASSGDEVMVVIPENQTLFGYAAVSQQGFGKVKIGQRVNIRLSGFPYEEFGVVAGEVQHISSIARDGKYMVHIALPNGLKTNYHQQLAFSQEMQGEAHIVTEDLRLIERIFFQMRRLWQE